MLNFVQMLQDCHMSNRLNTRLVRDYKTSLRNQFACITIVLVHRIQYIDLIWESSCDSNAYFDQQT